MDDVLQPVAYEPPLPLLPPGHRLNFSVHRSEDGGRTWPRATVVYAGDAAYSDMAFTRNGSVAVLFERGSGGDPYRWVSFGVLPVPQ